MFLGYCLFFGALQGVLVYMLFQAVEKSFQALTDTLIAQIKNIRDLDQASCAELKKNIFMIQNDLTEQNKLLKGLRDGKTTRPYTRRNKKPFNRDKTTQGLGIETDRI